MSDRFSPSWNQLRQPLEAVIALLSGDGHLLIEAFLLAAGDGAKAGSVAEVKAQLRGMSMGVGIPWILFNTISNLILSLPKPTISLQEAYRDTQIASRTFQSNGA